MNTTVEKYNKLCDMNIINRQNYDINSRISIIIQEVQDLLDKYEKEARIMLGYDKKEDNKQ